MEEVAAPDLESWIFVKERGAAARSGNVYRSPDGGSYLRTGNLAAIRSEAEFGRMVRRLGFPVPEVTEVGQFSEGVAYFVETSAGTESFGSSFGSEYAVNGCISDKSFDAFCGIALHFLDAQARPDCRQTGLSELRVGVQLENVQRENPDIAELFERAVTKTESRTRDLPLVLTHGDLSPFNILPGGVIDFEERFIAPFGLDAVTCIAFQRFWDHPKQDGTGTMRLWDFDRRQIADFLAQADEMCASRDIPQLSHFFDDFLMLKAIWALCYERPADDNRLQVQRWLWRKRVAAYCAESYLLEKPIGSESFRTIGLGYT